MIARAHIRRANNPLRSRPGVRIAQLHVGAVFLYYRRAQKTRSGDHCVSKAYLASTALRFALAFN
jgi:hypothetical protein